MQSSFNYTYTDLNTDVLDMTERCCLPENTLEQLIIMNLYMSLLVPDVESVCVSKF